MCENSPRANRLVEIDILKGLGILAMVAGHVGFGELFNFAIHPFNMPLFFLASGFLYRCKGSFSLSIKKKAKTLLVPYLLFGLLFCIIWAPVQLFRGEPLLDLAFHLLFMNSEGVPIGGALWFLTAFFFASVLFDLIFRLTSGGGGTSRGPVNYSWVFRIFLAKSAPVVRKPGLCWHASDVHGLCVP